MIYAHLGGVPNHRDSDVLVETLRHYRQVEKEAKAHNHYFKDVSNLKTLDVYRVLQLFEVGDPCIQHAVKKLLVAGGRGHKSMEKDVQDAIDSLLRWQQMRKEEGK